MGCVETYFAHLPTEIFAYIHNAYCPKAMSQPLSLRQTQRRTNTFHTHLQTKCKSQKTVHCNQSSLANSCFISSHITALISKGMCLKGIFHVFILFIFIIPYLKGIIQMRSNRIETLHTINMYKKFPAPYPRLQQCLLFLSAFQLLSGMI